jgi:hypothetical protein
LLLETNQNDWRILKGMVRGQWFLSAGVGLLAGFGCGTSGQIVVRHGNGNQATSAVSSTAASSGGATTGTLAGSGTSGGGGSTSGTTTGGSTSSGGGTTTAGTSTSSGTTGGGGTGESWIWLFTDYANSLDALNQNTASFTHVSPALYHMNYDYKSGVPSFTSGPTDGCSAAPTTTDMFNGLTSTQIAQKVHAMGMKVVALIYGGAANCGTDLGIENVLNDSPAGTQKAFIDSLVSEAQTKGYDGWNLDWETNLNATPYAPLLITFLGAAHKAFAKQSLSLSIDVLGSNVEQSWCSGGSGFVDLDNIGPVIDGVIIESYQALIGSSATSCPTGLPNPLACNYPSATDCPIGECVASDLALLCAHLPMAKAVIGLDAISRATNPIAGTVMSTVESYGFKRVAVWPDSNSHGLNGSYLLLDPTGIVPANTDWYKLLKDFLAHWSG